MRDDHYAQILAAIHGAALTAAGHTTVSPPAAGPMPFVTVSRQAGAGGRTLGQRLVDRLNELDPGPRPWTCWDHELVERAAAEHHLPAASIERLAGPPTPWLQDLIRGFGHADGAAPDEYVVYRKVAVTIRGLARLGRCVIVGRGGVFATDDMPGGVHVRLVAPLDWRVAHMARVLNASAHDAAATVARVDRDRAAFYQKYWPHKPLTPERFSITLNTALAGGDVGRLAECALPLVLPGKVTAVEEVDAAWASAEMGD